MNNEKALAIISEACAAFTGRLSDHQQIQAAIAHVKAELAKLAPTPTEPSTPTS